MEDNEVLDGKLKIRCYVSMINLETCKIKKENIKCIRSTEKRLKKATIKDDCQRTVRPTK